MHIFGKKWKEAEDYSTFYQKMNLNAHTQTLRNQHGILVQALHMLFIWKCIVYQSVYTWWTAHASIKCNIQIGIWMRNKWQSDSKWKKKKSWAKKDSVSLAIFVVAVVVVKDGAASHTTHLSTKWIY